MRRLWPALLLAALVLAAYGRTLANGFAYDDHPFLLENRAVTSFASPIDVLTDARTHSGGDVVRSYRPLRTLLFACEHAVFGRDPRPYHAAGLLLHLATCVLAWRLSLRFLSEPLALLAACVLACHPLAAEVVASIKAQDDLVAAALSLGAACLFVRSPGPPEPLRAAAIVALYALAMLAKESAIVLPALLVGLDLALDQSLAHPLERRRRASLPLIAAMAVACGLFLALRQLALPPDEEELVPWLFASALAHAPRYALLFLSPARLTIDYSGLAHVGPGSLAFWASIAGQALVAALLWRTRLVPVRLGLAWFYLTLLPSLNPLGGVITFAERFAYLPLLGLAWIAVALVDALARRLPLARRAAVRTVFLAAALAALVLRASARSADWSSDESLFRAALAADPRSTVMRAALAKALVREGRTSEAEELVAAREPAPGRIPASHVERAGLEPLGLLALERGDWEEAADVFGRIAASPYAQWHDRLNLGTALVNLGRRSEARAEFEAVLRDRPDEAAAHRMLGRIALDEERWEDARVALGRAAELDPASATGAYFLVFATWRARGEAAALAAVDDAGRRGIRFGRLYRQDRERWSGAGAELEAALDRE